MSKSMELQGHSSIPISRSPTLQSMEKNHSTYYNECHFIPMHHHSTFLNDSDSVLFLLVVGWGCKICLQPPQEQSSAEPAWMLVDSILKRTLPVTNSTKESDQWQLTRVSTVAYGTETTYQYKWNSRFEIKEPLHKCHPFLQERNRSKQLSYNKQSTMKIHPTFLLFCAFCCLCDWSTRPRHLCSSGTKEKKNTEKASEYRN